MSNNITNYATYNERMAKPLIDKLFFVDKVDADVFVDFGCGDGTLIRQLVNWYPKAHFIGYDNDPTMLSQNFSRKELTAEDNSRVDLYHDWDFLATFLKEAKVYNQKTALILSSVIHEVYHYTDVKEIELFWKRVFTSGFDYVIIRDMIPCESIDRPSDVNDVAKILRKFRKSKELQDFHNCWGSITNNKNLVHFLLKYQYAEPNWEREVKENYIPLYWEDLLAMLPIKYSILYHEHYVLPYIKRQIKQDFEIELKDPTHLKMVLECV